MRKESRCTIDEMSEYTGRFQEITREGPSVIDNAIFTLLGNLNQGNHRHFNEISEPCHRPPQSGFQFERRVLLLLYFYAFPEQGSHRQRCHLPAWRIRDTPRPLLPSFCPCPSSFRSLHHKISKEVPNMLWLLKHLSSQKIHPTVQGSGGSWV